MAKITVQETETDKGWEFDVTVEAGGTSTNHRVTLTSEDYDRISGPKTASPATLVRKSFEFLLEHEPKESILSSFDLPVIGRYFSNYEHEIRNRL